MGSNNSRSVGLNERRVRWFTHLLVLAVGTAFGWDIGLKMGGTWMGVVMAANTAFFASLAAGAAIDICVSLRAKAGRS